MERLPSTAGVGAEVPGSISVRGHIDFALRFLRRQYFPILICLPLAAALAALYLFTAPPTFTATSTMMIDTRKGDSVQSLFGESPADATWIESQIGLMRSQGVAANVVKQLHLADDAAATGSTPGLFEKILTRFRWSETPAAGSEAERTARAIGTVVGGLEIHRVGTSYLIQINFHSSNPELSTKVANAMVDAYAVDQLNAKYQASRRASDWLQERLQTLREQASGAERAVIEFKAKNNMVSAGGRLMNDQQLSDLTTQVAAARTHTAEIQARLDRMEAIRRGDADATGNETISEAQNNGIISRLRAQYLELVNREANWSEKYGKNHTAVVNVRNQIKDIRKSMLEELGSIAESYKSELEIAKRRQDEVEKKFAETLSKSQETNQAQVLLYSLEATAQSYRKLYDNFLQRYMESVQQQSFPITEARLVSAAPSASKSDPKPGRVWTTALFAGIMLGVGLGALREIMDRVFRTREQVHSALETQCLALVPLVPRVDTNRLLSKRRSTARQLIGRATSERMELIKPRKGNESRNKDLREIKEIEELIGSIKLSVNLGTGAKSTISVADRTGPRKIRTDKTTVLHRVVHEPLSPYAEAMRSIKLSVDLFESAKSTRVIGVTSALPSEGKSTVATGIAQLMAQSGARVILVDCDLRNPSLSRALAPQATVGLVDVVIGTTSLDSVVWNDPETRMAFLPAVLSPASTNPPEILSSDAMKRFFESLQVRYDYVIVDLSPLAPVVDVRATCRLIDSYILVVEWGRTKVEVVQHALELAPEVQENIIGVVLNKVDLAAMGRYDGHSARYYQSYHNQYFAPEKHAN